MNSKTSDMKPCCLVTILLLLVVDCYGIVMRDVGVPPYAVQGKKAVLTCDFDLEGQELYAVKWYRNGQEFYRFVPADPTPMVVYARPGVHVDKSRSDERQITLTNLSPQSMGRYRCEVSTEGPSFATVSDHGDMIIVVLPSHGPKIQGGKPRYKPGDLVNVNCTSAESKPAADLFWTINGVKADPAMLMHYPIVNTSNELHTATLGLRFKVAKSDFNANGDMKLKCTARIDTIYLKTNEKSAEGLKQKRASASGYHDQGQENGISSALGFNAAKSSHRHSWTLLGMSIVFQALLLRVN